jgi:hypothetical protein
MSTSAVLVCGQQQQQTTNHPDDDSQARPPPLLLLVRVNLEPSATGSDLKRDVCALLGVSTATAAARAFFGGRPIADAERVADGGVPTSPRALRGGGGAASGLALRAAGADERVYPVGWAQGSAARGWCYLRKRDRAWPPERDAERVGAWPLAALLAAALLLRALLPPLGGAGA